MPSLGEFQRKMYQLEAKVRVGSKEKLAKTAARIHLNLVLSTPVDEGTARSNWIIGIGFARTRTVKAVPAAASIAQAKGHLSRFNPITHSSIHITNNLPYIVVLNEGSSSQAPPNFIELAIRQGVIDASSFRIIG